MNPRLDIQHAVMCLQTLEDGPFQGLSVSEISRRQGIPFNTCRSILTRLEIAGVIKATASHRYRLDESLCEITALEILQALGRPAQKQPAFQLMYGPAKGTALHRTLEAAGRTRHSMPTMEG